MKKYNVLITGSSGLLGSNLVIKLSKSDRIKKIICIDKKQIKFLQTKNKKIKYIHFDLRNIQKFKKILKKEKINIIFHTAAITQVLEAFKKPQLTYDVNVNVTTKLMEAVRILDKNIIFIYSSSDKAYGKLKLNQKYLETDKLIGDFTYDASKSASDIIAQSYAKTYNIRVGILRCGNIFGPGDLNFDRLLPGLFLNIIKNKKLKLRSNGTNVREYLHVDNVVEAYNKLLIKMLTKKDKNLFIYNIGSKYNFSVNKFCQKILELLKINNLDPIIVNNSKIEIQYQKLNFLKAKKELKWKPKDRLEEDIKNTYEWYKLNFTQIKKIITKM